MSRFRLTLKPIDREPIAQVTVDSESKVSDTESVWLDPKTDYIGSTDYPSLIYVKEVECTADYRGERYTSWATVERLFVQK